MLDVFILQRIKHPDPKRLLSGFSAQQLWEFQEPYSVSFIVVQRRVFFFLMENYFQKINHDCSVEFSPAFLQTLTHTLPAPPPLGVVSRTPAPAVVFLLPARRPGDGRAVGSPTYTPTPTRLLGGMACATFISGRSEAHRGALQILVSGCSAEGPTARPRARTSGLGLRQPLGVSILAGSGFLHRGLRCLPALGSEAVHMGRGAACVFPSGAPLGSVSLTPGGHTWWAHLSLSSSSVGTRPSALLCPGKG